MQRSRRVLAIVRHTIPEGPKGNPAVVFGASLVYIPAHQTWTSLTDALAYLKHAKGDYVILVLTPNQLTYSPQPQGRLYFSLVPINSNHDEDHGPLNLFAVATLHVASREGWDGNIWPSGSSCRHDCQGVPCGRMYTT